MKTWWWTSLRSQTICRDTHSWLLRRFLPSWKSRNGQIWGSRAPVVAQLTPWIQVSRSVLCWHTSLLETWIQGLGGKTPSLDPIWLPSWWTPAFSWFVCFDKDLVAELKQSLCYEVFGATNKSEYTCQIWVRKMFHQWITGVGMHGRIHSLVNSSTLRFNSPSKIV